MSNVKMTYQCQLCDNIVEIYKGMAVPYKCKAVVKSKAFRSGSMKCGGLMVKSGKSEDKKVSA